MQLRPVRRRSVSDDVFEQLTAQILEGGLEPGSALPAERALADTLGVNRQAVREALHRLAEAGLVEIVHGDATRVRDPHRSGGLALLPRLLVRSDGSVDVAVARSILELRACLGPDAARRCAERASSEQALELARSVTRMRELADDLLALQLEQTIFWDHLVDGADNVAYRLAYNSLRETYEPTPHFSPTCWPTSSVTSTVMRRSPMRSQSTIQTAQPMRPRRCCATVPAP